MIRLRRMPAVMISTERAAVEDADEGKVHLVVDYRAGARPVTRPAESTTKCSVSHDLATALIRPVRRG